METNEQQTEPPTTTTPFLPLQVPTPQPQRGSTRPKKEAVRKPKPKPKPVPPKRKKRVGQWFMAGVHRILSGCVSSYHSGNRINR